jgi:hypothetical protein
LATVEDRRKKFTAETGDNGQAINRAHTLKALRDRERRALSAATQGLQGLAQELVKLKGQLGPPAKPLADREIASGPNPADWMPWNYRPTLAPVPAATGPPATGTSAVLATVP